jgi:hypothetical protein
MKDDNIRPSGLIVVTRLPKDVRERLFAAAETRGISTTALLREITTGWLDNPQRVRFGEPQLQEA